MLGRLLLAVYPNPVNYYPNRVDYIFAAPEAGIHGIYALGGAEAPDVTVGRALRRCLLRSA
jgi:hypothetical protein